MTKNLPPVGSSIMIMPFGNPSFCPLAVVAGYAPKEDGSVWLAAFVEGEEWFVNPDLCALIPEGKLFCNVFNDLGNC